MVTGVVDGWTIYDTDTVFLHDFPCFYALRETDNWTISAMNVPGFFAYGCDHGGRAILRHRRLSHFRRSWVDHERCTAISVAPSMLLSVYMPHSGHGEED